LENDQKSEGFLDQLVDISVAPVTRCEDVLCQYLTGCGSMFLVGKRASRGLHGLPRFIESAPQ